MTQAQLNTHIIHIQNLYGDFVNDEYLTRLKRGKVCKEVELSMLVTQEYIEVMYRYQPFDGAITYAYSFEIIREGEDSVTITITIGAESIVYTGDGDLDEILAYFVAQIATADTFVASTYIDEDILYVYSSDTDLNFDTTTTVSSSDEDEATIEETNMENTYCTILDLFNCLTTEQLCIIINHGVEILKTCNCNG